MHQRLRGLPDRKWRIGATDFLPHWKGDFMKRIPLVLFGFSLLVFGSLYAKEVRDWRDLDRVHNHVQEAIKEMERARAANHYDMDGHGAKAEEAMRQAERELHEAVESAKRAK
jgi:hypothetical protein